jgi:hypothetical protein
MTAWLRGPRTLAGPTNTNGLIGWWNFAGNSLLDASGNGNYALKTAQTRFAPGPYGQVLNNAGSACATAPTTSKILSALPFTWMLYAFQSVAATTGTIGAAFNGTNGGIFIVNSGIVKFQGAIAVTSGAGVFTIGRWHHVAVSVTGALTTIYVDGVQIVAGAQTIALPMTALALGIASGTSAAAQYADVRFYNRILSAQEIRTIAMAPLKPWANFTLPLRPAAAGPLSVPIFGASSAASAFAPAETISVFI